jgi:hypothetical protein
MGNNVARNGVLMNMPIVNPNKYIHVIEIATGGKLALPSLKYFDPKRHRHIVEREEAVKSAQVVASEAPASVERYEELKAARAWLKKDLKDEYSKLKEIYG